jgi:hypothetical protein
MRKTVNRPNAFPADGTNPVGFVKDESVKDAGDGTPVDNTLLGDVIAALEYLVVQYSTLGDSNDLSEDNTNGFQIIESIENVPPPDDSVSTVKIQDLAVITSKLADLAVTTAKIVDANITTPKIADDNVTLAKIENFSEYSILGKNTAGSGDGLFLTLDESRELLTTKNNRCIGVVTVQCTDLGNPAGLTVSYVSDNTNDFNVTGVTELYSGDGIKFSIQIDHDAGDQEIYTLTSTQTTSATGATEADRAANAAPRVNIRNGVFDRTTNSFKMVFAENESTNQGVNIFKIAVCLPD